MSEERRRQPERVHVMAAALFDERGEILISRRHDDSHQGGLWEFPGGKLDPGEDPRAGLARELGEELGVAVRIARPLIRVAHDYPDRSVLLDVWRIDAWDGDPCGREGQDIAWVAPERLRGRRFPAADEPIITAAQLPERYLITPEPGSDEASFLERVEDRLRRGIRLVQLRAKTLDAGRYLALAQRVATVCRAHRAKLLLNAAPALVDAAGADGVHLPSARLMELEHRPLGPSAWVAASCHDARELAHAERIGADFAVLSPVRATPSHPDAQPLGWARLRELTEPSAIPVYALGGMREADLAAAWEHGAQGIAAVRGLWDDTLEGS